MGAFVVSDHEPTTVKVREVLRREGQDCPFGNLFSIDRAVEFLAGVQPEMVVVILSPHPDRTLAVLVALRAQTQAPILAVGPVTDSRLVLQSLRAGATDFVDEAEVESELRAALSRVRVGLQTQGRPGRLVALLAPSGGSGSSTLAVNVATVIAQEHKSVLLIDMKRAAGDLADLLDLKPTHTLADLCQNAARMDRVMFEGTLVRHSSGVHLLAPPRTFVDMPYVTPEGVRQALLVGAHHLPLRGDGPRMLLPRGRSGSAAPGRHRPARPPAGLYLPAEHAARGWSTSRNWASIPNGCASSPTVTGSRRKCRPQRPRRPWA